MEKLYKETREGLKKKKQNVSTYSDANCSFMEVSNLSKKLPIKSPWSKSQPNLNITCKRPIQKREISQPRNNHSKFNVKLHHETQQFGREINHKTVEFIRPLSKQQHSVVCFSSSACDGLNDLNVNYNDQYANKFSADEDAIKKAKFLQELNSTWSFSDSESRDTNRDPDSDRKTPSSKICIADAECSAFISSPDLIRAKKVGRQNPICKTSASVSDLNPFLALAKAAAQAAATTAQHRLPDANIALLISSTLSLDDYCNGSGQKKFRDLIVGPTSNAYWNIEKILDLSLNDDRGNVEKSKKNGKFVKEIVAKENMKNLLSNRSDESIGKDQFNSYALEQLLLNLPKQGKTTFEELILKMLKKSRYIKPDETTNGNLLKDDAKVNDSLENQSVNTAIDFRPLTEIDREKGQEKLSMMHEDYKELIKRTENAKLDYFTSMLRSSDIVKKNGSNKHDRVFTKNPESARLLFADQLLLDRINELIRNNLPQHNVIPEQAFNVKPCYVEPKKKTFADNEEDEDFESVVEKAKRSWASIYNNNKQRSQFCAENLKTTTDYNSKSEILNGNEETEISSFELCDHEERFGTGLKERQRSTPKLKMSDLRRKSKSSSGDRDTRASRTKSVDYLADKNTGKFDVPENQLKKILGERNDEDLESRLSAHELRFRKSLEKLQIPDWYLNSEHCWSNNVSRSTSARSGRQWPTASSRRDDGAFKTSESSSGLEYPLSSMPSSPWTTNKPLSPRRAGSYVPKAQTPIIVAKFTEAPRRYILDSPEEKENHISKLPTNFSDYIDSTISSIDYDKSDLQADENPEGKSSRSIEIPKSFFERFKWEIEEARKNRVNDKLNADVGSKPGQANAFSCPPIATTKETDFSSSFFDDGKNGNENCRSISHEAKQPGSEQFNTRAVSCPPNLIKNSKKPVMRETEFGVDENVDDLISKVISPTFGEKYNEPAASDHLQKVRILSYQPGLTTDTQPVIRDTYKNIGTVPMYRLPSIDSPVKVHKEPRVANQSVAIGSKPGDPKSFANQPTLVTSVRQQVPMETDFMTNIVEVKNVDTIPKYSLPSGGQNTSEPYEVRITGSNPDEPKTFASSTSVKQTSVRETDFTTRDSDIKLLDLGRRSQQPTGAGSKLNKPRALSSPPQTSTVVKQPIAKETDFTVSVVNKDEMVDTVSKNVFHSVQLCSFTAPRIVANGSMNENAKNLGATGGRTIVIEASDVLHGKTSEPPDPYVNVSTLKEVLDNFFELSKITPKTLYKAPADQMYREVVQSLGGQAFQQPSDYYGIFALNKTTMATCEKIPEIAGNLLKKEILWIKCDRCKQVHPVDESGVQYVPCRYCYTYYCSENCLKINRLDHWSKCGFAKLASLTKRILNKIRSDQVSRQFVFGAAELGYKQRGRGCVNLLLKDDIIATSFLNSGWSDLPDKPESYFHYQPMEQMKSSDSKLILSCLNYNIDNECVLKVCILVDKDKDASREMSKSQSHESRHSTSPSHNSVSRPVVTSTNPYESSKNISTVTRDNRDNNKAKSSNPPKQVEDISDTQISRPFERSRSLPYRRKSKQEIDAKLVLKSVLKSLENIVPDKENLSEKEQQENQRKLSTPTTPTSGSFSRKNSYRHSVGISGRKYYRSDGSFSPITWDVNSNSLQNKEFKFPATETDV